MTLNRLPAADKTSDKVDVRNDWFKIEELEGWAGLQVCVWGVCVSHRPLLLLWLGPETSICPVISRVDSSEQSGQ